MKRAGGAVRRYRDRAGSWRLDAGMAAAPLTRPALAAIRAAAASRDRAQVASRRRTTIPTDCVLAEPASRCGCGATAALAADGQGSGARRQRRRHARAQRIRMAASRRRGSIRCASPRRRFGASCGKAEKRGARRRVHHRLRRARPSRSLSPTARMASLCIDVGEIRADVDGSARARPSAKSSSSSRRATRRASSNSRTRSRPTSRWRWSPQQGRARLRARAPGGADAPVRAEERRLAPRRDRRRGASPRSSATACADRRQRARACSTRRRSRVGAPDAHRHAPAARMPRARRAVMRAGAASSRCVGEVRWLAHALGAARDCDVFALETLPAFAAGRRASAQRRRR